MEFDCPDAMRARKKTLEPFCESHGRMQGIHSLTCVSCLCDLSVCPVYETILVHACVRFCVRVCVPICVCVCICGGIGGGHVSCLCVLFVFIFILLFPFHV